MFDPLWTTSVSIPLFQIMLIMGASTLALVLGKMKISIVIGFCGLLYWGYFCNPSLKSTDGTFQMDAFSLACMGFGVAIVFLVLVGLLTHQD